MSSPSNTSPRVAVVGAGVAGLTLARVLQVNGIHADIFERDTSSTARSQGGSLDLKVTTGQKALKIAQLYEEFRKYMRLEDQDLQIVDKDLNVAFAFKAPEGHEGNPEIDRGILKSILLKEVNKQVKWGVRVERIERQPEGVHLVHLADGTSQEYDLVVGADGCHSKIRPYVSKSDVMYTGVLMTEQYIPDAKNSHPDVCATVGNGTLYSITNGNGLLAQHCMDGKLRVYTLHSLPEEWGTASEKSGIPWNGEPEELKKTLLGYFDGWCEPLRALIKKTEGRARPWPIYQLPVGHRWEHKQGLTLIGDAAHIMSPAAGEGANLAMFDGAMLGEAIVEGWKDGDLDRKVEAFEQLMFDRAEISARLSDTNLKKWANSTQDLSDIVRGFQEGVAL